MQNRTRHQATDARDAPVIRWARGRSAPWYYTSEPGLPVPCLKVQCGYVTAYFHHGRLARLGAQADAHAMNDLFAERIQLFGLTCRNVKKAEATYPTLRNE